ncbi:MAG TPA: hypothetical protein VGV89_07885 [Thermoplasmata archaeon]|nr:hypothetical protein [Thermoplasmata archaeon]
MNQPDPDSVDVPRPLPDDSHSQFRNGFPLFLFGATCVLLAVFLELDSSVLAKIRAPIWLLFLSIGIIALAGGAVAIVAGRFDDRTTNPSTKATGDPRGTPPPSSTPLRPPSESDEQVAALRSNGYRGT